MNEEIHYFLTKGRITRTAFFTRVLFSLICTLLLFTVYVEYAVPLKSAKTRVLKNGATVIDDHRFEINFYIFEYLIFYVVPTLLVAFVLAQAAKRIHDVDKSGWFALIPIYNIVLLLSEGTKGGNNYGVDPRPARQIIYFDEL